MVSSCPRESDPRPNVAKFVTDPEELMIGGLRSEGIDGLMDVIQAELEKQYPDARMVVLSKEIIADHRVFTKGDLRNYLRSLDWDGVKFVVIRNELCICQWLESFKFIQGWGIVLFMGGAGCRGVPMCTKLPKVFDSLE